jgi:hypothetical protein
MKFRLWALLLKVASFRHLDSEHRAQLLRLADELRTLDDAAPNG